MYDPTFHFKTLKKEIKHGDCLKNRELFDEIALENVIRAAVLRSEYGYEGARISSRIVNKSPVYKLDDFSDEIVLRKIGTNLRRVTGRRQTNRSSLIKCIRSLATEGFPFCVHKIDIRNFFGSVKKDLFISPITKDSAFPPSTIRLLESFFKETESNAIIGLPRGLSLSSVLSKYIMKDFDSEVSKLKDVYFYARFVDDMIFITKNDDNPAVFLRSIQKQLPDNLYINPSKTQSYSFSHFSKSNKHKIEGEFDFLGYKFKIGYAEKQGGSKICRRVSLDISSKKVIRIKTRICISALQFIKTGRFDDLVDRIRLLTANYIFYDVKLRARRKSGIYHNYHLINEQCSTALKDLDDFYINLFTSKNGKIGSKLYAKLTNSQRKILLNYSFRGGFKNKSYFAFKAKRISDLRKCWVNA